MERRSLGRERRFRFSSLKLVAEIPRAATREQGEVSDPHSRLAGIRGMG